MCWRGGVAFATIHGAHVMTGCLRGRAAGMPEVLRVGPCFVKWEG